MRVAVFSVVLKVWVYWTEKKRKELQCNLGYLMLIGSSFNGGELYPLEGAY